MTAFAPGWYATQECHGYPKLAEANLERVQNKMIAYFVLVNHVKIVKKIFLPITFFLSTSMKSKALEKVSLRRAMFSGMYKLFSVLKREVNKH